MARINQGCFHNNWMYGDQLGSIREVSENMFPSSFGRFKLCWLVKCVGAHWQVTLFKLCDFEYQALETSIFGV